MTRQLINLVLLLAGLWCETASFRRQLPLSTIANTNTKGRQTTIRSTHAIGGMEMDVQPLPYTLESLNGQVLTATGIGGLAHTAEQVRIHWQGGPQRILFLTKPDPEMMMSGVVEVALLHLLSRERHVLVEESVLSQLHLKLQKHIEDGRLGAFNPANGRSGVDLIVTFGGDGLLMHCSSLFQTTINGPVPPIISFDFGSLGFLAPFNYEGFEAEIDRIITSGALLTIRMRLECSIWRNGQSAEAPAAFSHNILNEVVIDRGTAPFLSVIDVHCNSQYMTTVQGDGIIIATPTGSTAYSLAAGGSMVHPSVPAILITPICAHTLSIRPLLLPDSSVLQCDLPLDARANGWVSFDGKYRQELQKGDSVKIQLSNSPMPTVARQDFTVDWLNALRTGFNFNERARQNGGASQPKIGQ